MIFSKAFYWIFLVQRIQPEETYFSHQSGNLTFIILFYFMFSMTMKNHSNVNGMEMKRSASLSSGSRKSRIWSRKSIKALRKSRIMSKIDLSEAVRKTFLAKKWILPKKKWWIFIHKFIELGKNNHFWWF